jgi:hypothetical protein
VHFLWHLFENRGIILFTELVLFLSWQLAVVLAYTCLMHSFVWCCNYALSEFTILSNDQNFLIMVTELLTRACG